MYSHISAIAILPIMNLIIVRDPMYTLPPTVYRPSFFGEVSHVLNFEKKRMSDRYCPVWYIVIVIGR